MEEKKYDIKETKEMLAAVFTLGNAVGKSLEDGKIGFDDFANFIPVLPKLGTAIANSDQIPKELKDLDKEEVEEIKAFIKEEFDISNDALEEMIEKGLDLIVTLYYFIKGLINDLKK